MTTPTGGLHEQEIFGMDNSGEKHGYNPAGTEDVAARSEAAAPKRPQPQEVIYLPDLSGG